MLNYSYARCAGCVKGCSIASPPALKEVQVERPAYVQGVDPWWSEVIRRTALGAGADRRGEATTTFIKKKSRRTPSRKWQKPIFLFCFLPTALDESLTEIVPKLLKRFSSAEGYAAFEDALPTSENSTLSFIRDKYLFQFDICMMSWVLWLVSSVMATLVFVSRHSYINNS